MGNEALDYETIWKDLKKQITDLYKHEFEETKSDEYMLGAKEAWQTALQIMNIYDDKMNTAHKEEK